MLGKNVESTILNVLNVVNNGLYKHFPALTKAIAVSQGPSTDDTAESIDLFQPYKDIPIIVTTDIVDGGKGVGILTIFEIAHKLEAKCVALIDGDLLSIEPQWIRSISTPIIYGRADLTVPFYIRDKNDGILTNNLVYPFTRAVYSLPVRQPIAGEFGLSKELYEILRKHPLFPSDFGADVFITTTAAAEQMTIKEGLFALKIHQSTRRYLKPEEFLIPMFRQVTGCMFELIKYYEKFWKQRELIPNKLRFNEYFGQKPIPVKVNIEKMIKTFKSEFRSQKKIYVGILPDEIMSRLTNILTDVDQFDTELWAKIVYHFAASYKHLKIDRDKKAIIEALKTLWFGRLSSYFLETKDMNINEAERVIQEQASIFEKQFSYLKSIY